MCVDVGKHKGCREGGTRGSASGVVIGWGKTQAFASTTLISLCALGRQGLNLPPFRNRIVFKSCIHERTLLSSASGRVTKHTVSFTHSSLQKRSTERRTWNFGATHGPTWTGRGPNLAMSIYSTLNGAITQQRGRGQHPDACSLHRIRIMNTRLLPVCKKSHSAKCFSRGICFPLHQSSVALVKPKWVQNCP